MGFLGSYHQTWILHSQQEAIGTFVLLSQLGAYLSSCHVHIILNATMCRSKCYMSETAIDIWRSADVHESYCYLISFRILTSLLFLTHFDRYFYRPKCVKNRFFSLVCLLSFSLLLLRHTLLRDKGFELPVLFEVFRCFIPNILDYISRLYYSNCSLFYLLPSLWTCCMS